ncbi:hypothetical protein NP233_g8369 [Leucocoprinus birnbaumii]|uniref:DUF6533 domain-containing protein n=1 Tax=Leucocoprinus birnbaumii TaxID=56174 RepID=A0AAD5VMG3_9AGAR|nr:hypothetical protein NP233_g8369 [Leucocoprinus birnbaumii]
MPSLSDHIDHLTKNTKNISAAAHRAHISSTRPALFTNAILTAHLGDLIRDVDPSELGLFSLVHPERAAVQEKPAEIERVNFHGATPLRRPHPRHDDASRVAKDVDPELYAQAAMKYMDRYKLVRPMPRAQAQVQAILERIPVVRQSIDELNDNFYQLEQTRSSAEPDYKNQLEEEERRIRDLRARLTELTNKRTALSKAKKSHLDLAENRSVARKPIASSKPNPEEDEFWNTPAASARTFKFTGDNLLMDEKADFGDISTISFSATPVPKTTSNIFTHVAVDLPVENPKRRLFQALDAAPDIDIPSESPNYNPIVSQSPPTREPSENNVLGSAVEAELPLPVPEEPASDSRSGIVITHKVESITSKIWAVMADLVTTAAATKGTHIHDKPSARDLMQCLEHMSKVNPSDDLASVTNGGTPTAQQVLTATLLIGLLASSADYSLPLSKVKELLATRTEGALNSAQPNSSRIVYHCVAKRLLKIDRTGGEQVSSTPNHSASGSMNILEPVFHYTNVTRYLSGAGLVALVYDHILTLPSEISLIWPAPSSYAKYIFLFNRYLVPTCLLAIAWEMNHFTGAPLSSDVSNKLALCVQRMLTDNGEQTCRNMFSVIALLSVFSLGMANILVLLWVVKLWDRSRTIAWMMSIGLIISAATSSSFMIASLVELGPSVVFSPPFHMCILTRTTPKLIIVWGAPMVFETIVLVATWWNALSVPREANMPLRTALHRDGVTFFMALTLLRSANLSLAATRRPELATTAVFWVWSMTTLILNRSLLRLQLAENIQLVLNDLIDEELPVERRSQSRLTMTSEYEMSADPRHSLHLWESKYSWDKDEIRRY